MINGKLEELINDIGEFDKTSLEKEATKRFLEDPGRRELLFEMIRQLAEIDEITSNTIREIFDNIPDDLDFYQNDENDNDNDGTDETEEK